mmetsp:Transcript_18281/g.8503  ORF Transcript_18281/g.8503 Transcript_18281/m.8503 type:complete len:87 (-) Transcript_18281:61-321(-)
MEEEWDCSGVCLKANFYLFTEVAQGIPPEACYDKLYDTLEEYAVAGIVVFWIITVIFLTMICFSCYLCFAKRDEVHERGEMLLGRK